MEEIKYTHIATLYGFECYYNEHTHEVKGTTWLNDTAIASFAWLAVYIFNHEGFNITLIREL